MEEAKFCFCGWSWWKIQSIFTRASAFSPKEESARQGPCTNNFAIYIKGNLPHS